MQAHQDRTAHAESPSLQHLFHDRRIAAMLGLGFSSGILFLLVPFSVPAG